MSDVEFTGCSAGKKLYFRFNIHSYLQICSAAPSWNTAPPTVLTRMELRTDWRSSSPDGRPWRLCRRKAWSKVSAFSSHTKSWMYICTWIALSVYDVVAALQWSSLMCTVVNICVCYWSILYSCLLHRVRNISLKIIYGNLKCWGFK